MKSKDLSSNGSGSVAISHLTSFSGATPWMGHGAKSTNVSARKNGACPGPISRTFASGGSRLVSQSTTAGMGAQWWGSVVVRGMIQPSPHRRLQGLAVDHHHLNFVMRQPFQYAGPTL